MASKQKETTASDEYEENLSSFQAELTKYHPNRKQLRKSTFSGRRSWIRSDRPSLSEVLDVFPTLKKRKFVSLIIVFDIRFISYSSCTASTWTRLSFKRGYATNQYRQIISKVFGVMEAASNQSDILCPGWVQNQCCCEEGVGITWSRDDISWRYSYVLFKQLWFITDVCKSNCYHFNSINNENRTVKVSCVHQKLWMHTCIIITISNNYIKSASVLNRQLVLLCFLHYTYTTLDDLKAFKLLSLLLMDTWNFHSSIFIINWVEMVTIGFTYVCNES